MHLLCRMKPNGEAVLRTSVVSVCDNSAVQNSSKCWSSVVCMRGFSDLNASSDSIYDLTTCLIAAASLCYVMRQSTYGIQISLCLCHTCISLLFHLGLCQLRSSLTPLLQEIRTVAKVKVVYFRCFLE